MFALKLKTKSRANFGPGPPNLRFFLQKRLCGNEADQFDLLSKCTDFSLGWQFPCMLTDKKSCLQPVRPVSQLREDWLWGLCNCAYSTSAIRIPGLEPSCCFLLSSLLVFLSRYTLVGWPMSRVVSCWANGFPTVRLDRQHRYWLWCKRCQTLGM